MKKIFTALMVLLCSVALAGCQNMSNQDAGTITGAIAGGLLGSTVGGGSGKVLAIAAGSVAGAVIGNAIGKNMDENDRRRMMDAMEENQVGEPAYWRNQNSGYAYEVVPVRNVRRPGHEYCREYRSVATINGKKQQMYGTACRQPDGSWRQVS